VNVYEVGYIRLWIGNSDNMNRSVSGVGTHE